MTPVSAFWFAYEQKHQDKKDAHRSDTAVRHKSDRPQVNLDILSTNTRPLQKKTDM